MQHEIIDTNTGQPNYSYWIIAACLFLGQWFHNLKDYELPVIVMQLFQLAAWSAAIIAAIIGTYLSYKKSKKYHDPN